MTTTTFATAGANVHGRDETKAEASSEKATTAAISESLRGVTAEPSADGIKALVDLANKHGITPGAMKDVIAATLQAFNVGASQPSISREMPSLDEASFSRAGRTAASSNATESEGTPQAWRRSRLESGLSYADGRSQLRAWLKEINEKRRLQGLDAVRFVDKAGKLLVSDRFQPDEMIFNPVDNTISVVGTYRPLFHWKRFVAAYKAFFQD